MHEGFRRRADIINSTALHLLINAWPNNWLKALCSVEREPLPGYFAYADANPPLAVNLRTDRHAVTGGDKLLGLPQAPGSEWRLGEQSVTVRPLKAHQFVSRKTGHPAVADLQPFHFCFWYDHECDRINHLVDAGLDGDNLQPVTLTGTGIWYGERTDVPAGAEKQIGAGRAVLDQVRAAERLEHEPRATMYLQRLLEYLLPDPE